MTKNSKVLAVLGGIVIAIALVTAGFLISRIDSESPEMSSPEVPYTAPYTTTGPLTAPPCSATSPNGATYDPCALNPEAFKGAFWNALMALPYFTKWKTANPGEWTMLNAYLRDGLPYSVATQPVVRTSFGAIVRFGMISCKAWVNNPAVCNVP